MPPTAEKVEVSRWAGLQHSTILEHAQISTYPFPFASASCYNRFMGLYLYKASSSPDLYPHLFLIFFMHFSSPLDPSHLNFKLLSILSLEENLWMGLFPYNGHLHRCSPLSHPNIFSNFLPCSTPTHHPNH